jgi:hypothetical protein
MAAGVVCASKPPCRVVSSSAPRAGKLAVKRRRSGFMAVPKRVAYLLMGEFGDTRYATRSVICLGDKICLCPRRGMAEQALNACLYAKKESGIVQIKTHE